jgi:hypothetical protein
MDLVYVEDAGVLRVVNDEEKDLSFFNLLRRIMLQTTEFHAITETKVVEYSSNVPVGEVLHRLSLLPVKGGGSGELDASGPKRVTSSDVVAEFRVAPGIDVIELKEGEKIKIAIRSNLTNGRKDPSKIPYVMRRDGKDYVLEPLSELYGEEDCKRDVRRCVGVIERWIKLN